MHKRYFKMAGISILAVLFLIKPMSFLWASCQHNVVTVGARHDSEQLILGEIIVQLLENKTKLKVVRKFNLVSPAMAGSAIKNNQVDIIPEYTGTAYIVTLHGDLLHRPSDLSAYVRSEYQKRFHLQWLEPFGFNNSNALAVTKNLAKKYHLKTIADLKNYSSLLKIAVPSDFLLRDDGYKGLHDQYGLRFADVKLMEMGLLYSAIHSHHVNITMASTTDGRVAEENLVILKDNKHVFPDYSAAPIVREKVLARHPEIKAALNVITGKLTEDSIRKLNYKVDIEKQSVCAVVKDFLSKASSDYR